MKDISKLASKFLSKPSREVNGEIIYLDDPTGEGKKEEALIMEWLKSNPVGSIRDLLESKSFRMELLGGNTPNTILLLKLVRLISLELVKLDKIIELLGNKK